MLTFKNHCGQFHKTNTALVALTSLYVIGAAVALSAPYWVSSTSMLAPLAVFAATPLGIGVLAFVAIALTSLAISAIIKNNEISELKAPKLSVSSDDACLVLRVSSEDSKFIEENYKVGDKYRIDCANSKGEVFRIISSGQLIYKDNTVPILLGSIKLFGVSSLEVKDGDGNFEEVNHKHQLETLGLGTKENDAKELIIRFMPSTVVQKPAAEQTQEKKIGS